MTHKERLSHLGKRGAHARIHTLELGISRAHMYNQRFPSHTITQGGEGTQIHILNNHRKPQLPKQGDIRVSRNPVVVFSSVAFKMFCHKAVHLPAQILNALSHRLSFSRHGI